MVRLPTPGSPSDLSGKLLHHIPPCRGDDLVYFSYDVAARSEQSSNRRGRPRTG